MSEDYRFTAVGARVSEAGYTGTIAYVSREDSVSPSFTTCLARLMQRHPQAFPLHGMGNDVAAARNQIVAQAQGHWLWFIDSDQVFAPDALDRLLARDVPVVQALCLMRHPPHEPVLYEDSALTRNTRPRGAPRLVKVQSLGAGGTLYRKEVFHAVPPPWFEGPTGKEDTTFAAKLRAAGFPLHVDLAVPIGHLTPMAIWPAFDGLQWSVSYRAMNGAQVSGPLVGPVSGR